MTTEQLRAYVETNSRRAKATACIAGFSFTFMFTLLKIISVINQPNSSGAIGTGLSVVALTALFGASMAQFVELMTSSHIESTEAP